MMPMHFYKALNECNLVVPKTMMVLNESEQIKVTDEVMSEMFKFISEKYTSLDFSEIEKTNGNIKKFKYLPLLKDNLQILHTIYASSGPTEEYNEYINKMSIIIQYLEEHAEEISYLYEKRIGIIQMFYVSTVAAVVYGISALVSMTIRFVNNNDTDEIEVAFDEIPNPQRYIHLKNIDSAYEMLHDGTIDTVIKEYTKNAVRKVNESVMIPIAFAAPAIAVLAVPTVIYLSTKIIPFIREVIYSIYYSRVKWEMAIDLQINLVRTNIESLEQGRGSKKVIANQKKIVTVLEKIKDTIMIKNDKAGVQVKKQIDRENRELKVPTKPGTETGYVNDLLI